MSFLRRMFSGNLDQEDPRRFLVEVMLGAMEADGDVTEEEVNVLQKSLEEHELFQDLSGEQSSRLVDLAADSIREAGGGPKRFDAIAKGIPGRGHRLMSYALPCEVCVSDADLPESEIRYLEGLQKAIELSDDEARDIFEAARRGSGLLTLEEKTEKMHTLLPKLVQCMALMAAADGAIHEDELDSMRTILGKIPDMAVLTGDELDEAIKIGFERTSKDDHAEQLKDIATTITGETDRYWTAAYMMIVALADGKTDWREVGFLQTVQSVFELDDMQMDRAMSTASLFPNVDLGGTPE